MMTTGTIWQTTRWLLLGTCLAAAPVGAASLATTGPAQPLPEVGISIVSLPVAENLTAGSAALVPLMAAEGQATQLNTLETAAPSGGGDLGKPIDDISFLAFATDSGRVEAGAAHDALAQLQSPELKRVAETLIRDHGDLTARLMRIAEDKRWPVPQAVTATPPPAGTASADFDAIWTDQTIAAHERLAALYGAQAQGGEDRDLRRFARETLPVLNQHLAELRRLQK